MQRRSLLGAGAAALATLPAANRALSAAAAERLAAVFA